MRDISWVMTAVAAPAVAIVAVLAVASSGLLDRREPEPVPCWSRHGTCEMEIR